MNLGYLLVADRAAATNMMMEQMRQEALDSTLIEWKAMLIDYHAMGYDNSGGKMDKAGRYLLELGMTNEELGDIEYEIMDKIYGDDC